MTSDATKRMAKIMGAEFVEKTRFSPELVERARAMLAAEYQADKAPPNFVLEIQRGNINRVGLGAPLRAVCKALEASGHAELLEALRHARGAIASLPEDALGFNEPLHEEDVIWPLRDELLHAIDAVLNKYGGER